MVIFYAPKLGNEEYEWEDGAAGWCGDPATGRNPRFAVADGATEGFGSARWAQQLVAGWLGFDGPDGPDGPDRHDRYGERAAAPPTLHPDELRRWFALAQARWSADSQVPGASDLARLKLARVGSFATLLACELSGLAGPAPRWDGVALGDTVLFQVRGEHLVTQFPMLAAEDFGVNPDGVSTVPDRLAASVGRLARHGGRLEVGDRLYLATDAFAQWMVAAGRRDPRALWPALAALDHPGSFRALLAERRGRGEMANDDVTLLRVDLVPARATHLVVCL